MRSTLCGWAMALALAQQPHVARGEQAVAVPISRHRDSGPAFIPPTAFSPASAARGAGMGGAVAVTVAARGGRRRVWGVGVEGGVEGREGVAVGGCRRGGVKCLEGKKGGKSGGENDFMEAAKTLKKMEKNKERKTQERAKRRESNKPAPPRAREGDAQDDEIKLSKAGANPFKKERIVSKFDVSDIRKIEFVGSYEDDDSVWPQTNLPEIAFLGRSNVGKSSMLNTLFGESVAKVSKTPGRTRQINIFKAKNSKGKDVCYFADLPGYGYAKMSKDMQRTIETFLEMYLARRSNLKLLVLLADSRREPLASDAGVLEYAEDRENRPYKILMVATKVDKLNTMESVINIKRLQEAYDLPPGHPVSFSAISGQGKKEIWSYIRQAAAAG